MTNEQIIKLAREAGLNHFYDSEHSFSGITNLTLADAEDDVNDEAMLEILAPFVALIERELANK